MKSGQPRGPWTDAISAKTALPGSSGEAASKPPPIAALAQLVSLATWGSVYLRRDADIAALNRDHSTLRVCNKVAFAELRGLLRTREVPIAADPLTWLNLLRESGRQAIRLRCQQPAAGHNGRIENSWLLETTNEGTLEQWVPHWSLTNRYAAENRRWSVVYTRTERKSGESSNDPPPGINLLRENLVQRLRELQELARQQNQLQWSACLQNAITILDLEKPLLDSDYPDLLPPMGGTLLARQLVASTLSAMTGEADKSVPSTGEDPDQNREEYERLTTAMHAAIPDCVQHSANLWAEGS